MTPIDKFPNLNWTEHTRNELEEFNMDEVFARSQLVWQIKDIIAVGLIYTSFTGPPQMWFALAEGVTFRDLIDFRRLQEEIPIGTLVTVSSDFKVGHRFAKFYGFEDTGERKGFKEREFHIYRRV